jgi:hypothetical protein
MPLDLAPWLIQGGAVGLLAWGAVLLYTGKLVPRRVLIEQVDKVEERADDWRQAAAAADARAEDLQRQLNAVLAELARRSRDEVAQTPNGAGQRRRRGTGAAGEAARRGKTADRQDPPPGPGGRRGAR